LKTTHLSDWGSFRNKRVLITGGLGLIGSRLVSRLIELGAFITVVDNLDDGCGGNIRNVDQSSPRLNVEIHSVTDFLSTREVLKDFSYLFSLAGLSSHRGSMEDPLRDLQVNLVSQVQILEACRRVNPRIRIVYASTRQVYGAPVYLPVDERHPLNPPDVNGINRVSAESYFLLYYKAYDVKSTVLRLTNVYGPGMRVRDARQNFMGYWIYKALTGGEISVFGDGDQERDILFVSDCVEAFLRAALCEESVGEIINIGGGQRVSLKSLASIIINHAGGGIVRYVEFPSELKVIDIGSFHTDNGKAKRLLNWRPVTHAELGVSKTVAYYKKNLSFYI
jgi:UDP-glucose 4-epimerase